MELWEEHLTDPIVALDKASKCVDESQHFSWAEVFWEQGGNETIGWCHRCGRGLLAFSGCMDSVEDAADEFGEGSEGRRGNYTQTSLPVFFMFPDLYLLFSIFWVFCLMFYLSLFLYISFRFF